ncbi:sensor histidine kinase [Streptomyces tsukubensis]|uniref:histidine kinase n=1 Tax=Streptomyces tsukubensis TaxID=83656 RepID=A0A1V4A6X9_9ACTN|nr:histidine kinase [Streptomyces tsukubensis]OON77339.1 two-component sensor histidine kinase [Streptomyces tsukubensis]QFR92417.1 two-component sensor histidine kinase [Streptomyces tsukubensis]
MRRLLRPLVRPVTYTRWLHLFIASVWPGVWLFIDSSHMYLAAVLLALAGLVPGLRLAETMQARLLLIGHGPDVPDPGIAAVPSRTWPDRGRLAVWLQIRLVLGTAVAVSTVHLPALAECLIRRRDYEVVDTTVVALPGAHWWYFALAPLPILALYAVVVWAGALMAWLAPRLLGPSSAERLAALEERTEQLLERTRLARELHDSVGHALTVAVVQAGAARAAGSAEFTDRALGVIEETGRAALEDLDRVLRILREPERPASGRPTLAEADRLFDSARGAGAEVRAELSGPLETVPGPVSREGYRILQESLTNVLRHSGTVPVAVRIAVADTALELEVRNPLPVPLPPPERGGGSGLRGIRERAALLGGAAETGALEDEWRVRVMLPLS